MKAKTYGYIRVSTLEQNENRQVDALHRAGVEQKRIYIDKQSGRNFERKGYRALLRQIKKGDLLYITSIDRLGRGYEEIQQQWQLLTKTIGADICVLDMPLLDTRRDKDLMGSFIADIVLQILSFAAQNEVESIRRRQAEGIAAAKSRGVRFGRPRATLPDSFSRDLEAWENGAISLSALLLRYEVSESTVYRRLRQKRKESEKT